jgi:hypothetical protein
LATTKFVAGTKDELSWLSIHLSNASTSTSTIVDFCNVMSEYFSEGWMDDIDSSKDWDQNILAKLKATSFILKKINSKWTELDNIFPKGKISEQKQTELKSEIGKLYSNAQTVFLAVSNGPNSETKVNFASLSTALSNFGSRLAMYSSVFLAAASVATKIADGGFHLLHLSHLQHHSN